MSRFWWWDEPKFIKKIKQGIVFYSKPRKKKHVSEIKQPEINRRLETKRIRTRLRK